MLRIRRYRVFLFLAVVTVFLLYRFGTSSWEPALGSLQHNLHLQTGETTQEKAASLHNTDRLRQGYNAVLDGSYTVQPKKVSPPPLKEEIQKPVQQIYPPVDTAKAEPSTNTGASTGQAQNADPVSSAEGAEEKPQGGITPAVIAESGQGRKEANRLPSDYEPVHWQPLKENFPVSSTIKLPDGTPATPIPRIQARFDQKETAAQTKERQAKLTTIKEAFMHAWTGYKKYAWMKDELTPMTAQFKDPFNGWGATLVDSLDSLWMMGFKAEFEEAVEAVGNIDFTTSKRNDIPFFETVIRYLGGLLGAYDVSDEKYPILLKKAVELADVLMGAFDTPNRMPITYYQWKPTFASQPHRAPTRLVLAELGSMTVEFTRLAQLTKDQRYYDVTARVVEAMYKFQNKTRVPGLLPTYIDASGCSKQEPRIATNVFDSVYDERLVDLAQSGEVGADVSVLHQPAAMAFSASKSPLRKRASGYDEEGSSDGLDVPTVPDSRPGFYHEGQDRTTPTEKVVSLKATETPGLPECKPAGLDFSSNFGTDEYTLGSMADSTYEYFSKHHILLNGLNPTLKKLYVHSMDTAIEHLIYRVMIPDEKRKLLISGQMDVSITTDSNSKEILDKKLRYFGSHLNCFTGGMFALGGKVFNRPKDLEIAAQLTDACIWAYESTGTGIMPETFYAVGCQSTEKCAWNETRWHELLDPSAGWRTDNYEREMKVYESQVKVRESQIAAASASRAMVAAASVAAPTETAAGVGDAIGPEPKPTLEARGFSVDNSEKEQAINRRGSQLRKRVPPPGRRPAGAENQDRVDDEGKPLEIMVPSTSLSPGPLQTDSTTPTYFEPNYDNENKETTQSRNEPPTPTIDDFPPLWSPQKPIPHAEYVANKLKNERQFPGLVRADDRRYILRPEAIESVFYMHRITGDPYWREKGWKMVEAVIKHTKVEFGASGIENVFIGPSHSFPSLKTKSSSSSSSTQSKRQYNDDISSKEEEEEEEKVTHNDSMESFWLAETLKYCYLLFDDESNWSLDDWVFNTEAHLLRRGDSLRKTSTK